MTLRGCRLVDVHFNADGAPSLQFKPNYSNLVTQKENAKRSLPGYFNDDFSMLLHDFPGAAPLPPNDGPAWRAPGPMGEMAMGKPGERPYDKNRDWNIPTISEAI